MNKKDMSTIAKILLIGGIILCCFAQIVPWGEINVGSGLITVGVGQFYSWGAQTSSSFQEGSQFTFYFMMVTNSSFLNTWSSGEHTSLLIPIILSVLVLPLCIISLLFGYLDYRKFNKKNILIGREAGTFAVVSVVLFYIFIQFGIISINALISQYYSWSTGFYMMILAAILFFTSFLVKVKADSLNENIETPDEDTTDKSDTEIYCTACKRTVPDDAILCPYCGEKFE